MEDVGLNESGDTGDVRTNAWTSGPFDQYFQVYTYLKDEKEIDTDEDAAVLIVRIEMNDHDRNLKPSFRQIQGADIFIRAIGIPTLEFSSFPRHRPKTYFDKVNGQGGHGLGICAYQPRIKIPTIVIAAVAQRAVKKVYCIFDHVSHMKNLSTFFKVTRPHGQNLGI